MIAYTLSRVERLLHEALAQTTSYQIDPAAKEPLAAGGPTPLDRHSETWPESWEQVPELCPVCDCAVIPDPYLDSRAGPGWSCRLTGTWHHWQVRVERLRRLQRRYPR